MYAYGNKKKDIIFFITFFKEINALLIYYLGVRGFRWVYLKNSLYFRRILPIIFSLILCLLIFHDFIKQI